MKQGKRLKSKNIIAGGCKIMYETESLIKISNPISIDKQRFMYEVSQLDAFLDSCHKCGVKDLFIGQHNIIFPHGVLNKETMHRNKTGGYHKLRSPIISFYPSNKRVSDKMWDLVKKEIGEDTIHGGGHNYINIDETQLTFGCWTSNGVILEPIEYEEIGLPF